MDGSPEDGKKWGADGEDSRELAMQHLPFLRAAVVGSPQLLEELRSILVVGGVFCQHVGVVVQEMSFRNDVVGVHQTRRGPCFYSGLRRSFYTRTGRSLQRPWEFPVKSSGLTTGQRALVAQWLSRWILHINSESRRVRTPLSSLSIPLKNSDRS